VRRDARCEYRDSFDYPFGSVYGLGRFWLKNVSTRMSSLATNVRRRREKKIETFENFEKTRTRRKAFVLAEVNSAGRSQANRGPAILRDKRRVAEITPLPSPLLIGGLLGRPVLLLLPLAQSPTLRPRGAEGRI
jgi:hypothetical protein